MSQQHGLPPFHGQQGFNDLQLRQQQLIQNQLQLQRQRQLNRLDKDEKLQGTFNLPSVVEKGASSNQVTTYLNGRPTNDVFNYKSSNAMMGSEHKAAVNPEMLAADFMNWPEGRRSPLFPASNGPMIFSNDECTIKQSIRLVAQLADQSLFGKPISSIKGSLKQCSSFQDMSPDYPEMQMKSGGKQIGLTDLQHAQLDSFLNEQSTPEQGCLSDGNAISFPGPVSQNLFANDKNGLCSALALGSLQQNLSCQELHRPERASWFSNALETAARSAGPSHDVTCIDPTEEKILFGSDDYTWGSPGRSMNMIADGPCPGDPVESNDCFGAFPTINSGSWSALMQEAVQASSSIDGLQEEWSGLSFQNIEPPTQNHSGVSNDIGMQQNISGLQQPLKAPNNYYDRVPAEASCESFTQSSTISQSEQFSQAQGQKQLLQGSAQEGHIHESWAGHLHTAGSLVFPCNQVGSLRMNKESAVSTSHSHSQGMFPDCPDFASQAQNAEKNPSTDKENMTGTEEIACIDTISCHESAVSTSFDGPTTYIYHNRKVDLISQNMFRSPQSRHSPQKSNTVTPLGFYDNNTMIQIPVASSPSDSSLHPHNTWSSISRNSGLRLIPSSQRLQSFGSHARQIDRSSMDREWTQLDSAVSAQPPIPALGGPQSESLEIKSSLSGQTGDLPNNSSTRGHFSALTSSDSSYMENRLNLERELMQQQQSSSAVGHEGMGESINNSSRCQVGGIAYANNPSFNKQKHNYDGRTFASHPVQTSLSRISRKTSPLMLSASADTQSSVSKLYAPDKGHSQQMNANNSDLTGLLQQLPEAGSGSILHSSNSLSVSHQLGSSMLLHNAWSSASPHQHLSGAQLQRVIPLIPPLNLVSCSVSAQQADYVEVNHVEESSQGKLTSERTDIHKMGCASNDSELIPGHITDCRPALSNSTLVLSHQHNVSRDGQDSSLGSQAKHVTSPNISLSGINMLFHAQSMEPSDIGLPTYSLLQQVQAMKGADSATCYGLSAHPPFGIKDHNMKTRPRKRKRPPSKLLPWHMEVAAGSRRLQSIRMTEQDWILITNRLIEKMDDEADMIEDSMSAHQSRRRLVLTTQLMQQILPPLPYDVLSQEVAGSYGNATYLLTKSVLRDACGLLSSVSEMHSNHEMVISNKSLTSGKPRDNLLLKVMECFLGRLRMLENDFSRLLNRVPMLDINVDCQELNSFSIINRLVKFHDQGHTVVVGSSFSEGFSHKIYPQRYVIAIPMPRDLPEGMLCLSL